MLLTQPTKEKLSDLLSKEEEVEVLDILESVEDCFKGRISISYLNEKLTFEIEIPNNYPLTKPNSDNISIVFRNSDYIGLNHINNDGSVCFHPPKDDNLERKFSNEFTLLRNWIHDYYILEKEDDRYNYLIHNLESESLTHLFFTNVEQRLVSGSFGTFEYSVLSDQIIGSKKFKRIYRLSLDNSPDKWSEHFKEVLGRKLKKTGLFYYSDVEPLDSKKRGRKAADYWDDLDYYFTYDFKKHLYELLKHNIPKKYDLDSCIYLMLGYRVPNNEGYENHWDLIRIPKNRNPLISEKNKATNQKGSKSYFQYKFKKQEILWNKTENIDYSRFFGRGKLANQLTEKRILVIGCGALGSSLLEVLVRGGAKNLDIEDFDYVEGGNICRAKYSIMDVELPKTVALIDKLIPLSPFVNIRPLQNKLSYYNMKDLKDKIDIIFDCSADPEVNFILDQVDFQGHVFSLGISNKAKSLAAITGKNLTNQSKLLFDLVENEPPNYFPGTGCGYPTFEANFNDINSLLYTAIKLINNNFEEIREQYSFLVNTDFKTNYSISIDEFERFDNPSNKVILLVSKAIFSKIKNHLTSHYPKEFGGIFIGYRFKSNYVVTDVLIPDKYKNGKTIFVREPGNLNERLRLIHQETKGKIEYLGEWHSHPNGSTTPSITDINAMKDIVKNKEINIDNPILMIASLVNGSFNTDFYYSNNKDLIKYVR